MTKTPLKLVATSSTPRPRTLARRKSKRDAMLGEAAELFNARGIAAVSLNELAQRMGVGRATLYHYVADREDLVFQCYQRACEVMTEHLVLAEEDGGDGLARVAGFVRRVMAPDAPVTAAISDLAFLGEGPRGVIAKHQRRNVETLKGLLEAGVDDGSVRACDEEILAQTIIGVLAWAPLSGAWVSEGGSARFEPDVKAVVDLLVEGTSADPNLRFECPLDISAFNRLQAATFDRKSLSAMRVEQILMTASRLFNERGVDGASLDDIAAELGATKGAFYHYLADKDDLLARCYDRATEIYEAFVEAARQHGRNGLERGVIGSHLNIQAQAGSLSPLALWSGIESLPPERRVEQTRHNADLTRAFSRFAEEGVADGSRRPADIATTAVIRAGAFMWIPKWRPAEQGYAPRRVADEITGLFNRGLRKR